MIDISDLTKNDIGRWVTFSPHENSPVDKKELGKIKSYNKVYIYVVYKCAGEWNRFKAYTGVPTDPDMLTFCDTLEDPTKCEMLYKGRDYESSVKDANEPDHDLEYHDKKLEGR